MKQILLPLLFVNLLSSICFAQNQYNPRIAILVPYKTIYTQDFKEQADKKYRLFVDLVKNYYQKNEGPLDTGVKKLIMKDIQDLVNNSSNIDLFTIRTFIGFSVTPMGTNGNAYFAIKNIRCNGDKAGLKKIAAEQKVQFVLNFPNIEVYERHGIPLSKVNVQLYDAAADSILFTNEYQSIHYLVNPEPNNLGEDNEVQGPVNHIIKDITNQVFNCSHGPFENNIRAQRDSFLMNLYNAPFDRNFISSIILPRDTDRIKPAATYQYIMNNDRTKFIAFFAERPTQSNGRVAPESSYYDSHVIAGVNYDNKWYYMEVDKAGPDYSEKWKKEYFFQLTKWNYFLPYTADPDPEFWETDYFQTILSPSLYPDAFYGYFEFHNPRDSDFIGLGEIVAYGLQTKRSAEKYSYDSAMSANCFMPYYDSLFSTSQKGFWHYAIYGDGVELIYPPSKDVILNPLILSDTSEKHFLLLWFVFIPATHEFYEWKKFKPCRLKSYELLMPPLYDRISTQMQTLVPGWSHYWLTVDDKNFWDNYILLKKGNKYKYLEKVKR